MATAYRHFANKQALVEAMFETRISRFLTILEECEKIEDPQEAFETYLYRICELQANDRGIREAISVNYGIDKVGQYRERGKPHFMRLFDRARKTGAYRADCDVSDFVVAFWMIGRVCDATSREDPGQWRRQLDFLLDGLRAESVPRSDDQDTTAVVGPDRSDHGDDLMRRPSANKR